MNRLLIALAAMALVFALPVVGIVGYLLGHRDSIYGDGRATTVSRLSPDESILVRLVEVSITPSVDRRFRLLLQSDQWGTGTRSIFLSPEDASGRPPGTERLIWSKDGTKLLLVGRHFFVKEDLFLDNGDQLFFLYDVSKGQGWCNSEAPVGFPSLEPEMVDGVEFTEPVRLKK
jgi:hypothetical protein